jgi:Rieske 2Fe-2S family protein
MHALTASVVAPLLASWRPGYGLPRAFYHTPEVYAAEMAAIWRSGWLFAGHTCQLPHAGAYFTFTVDTDPVVVVRDGDGAARAFHNVCTHRGMVLCQQPAGALGGAIVCPYHQWTFALDGTLRACRGMHAGIDRSQLGLRPLAVETVAGLIFVSLAESPPPFAPAAALYRRLAGGQSFEHARVAHAIDYEIHADWKIVWENNRECYHCDHNHPQYVRSNFDVVEGSDIGDGPRRRAADAAARHAARWHDSALSATHTGGGLAAFPSGDVWYSATRTVLADGYATESLDGRRVAPLLGEHADPDVGVLRLRALPNFWNHTSCDHAVTTRLLPAGPRLTRATVYWLVDQNARAGEDYRLEHLLPFWQLTSEQDWHLCAMTQRGVDSTAYRPGPLSREREYNLEAFLRWYLGRLGTGAHHAHPRASAAQRAPGGPS